MVRFQAGSFGTIAWQGGQAYQNVTVQVCLINVGATLGNPSQSTSWLDTAVGLPSSVTGVPNTGQLLWNVPLHIQSGWYSFKVQSLGSSQKLNIADPVLVQGYTQYQVTVLGSMSDVTAIQSTTKSAWPLESMQLHLNLTGSVSCRDILAIQQTSPHFCTCFQSVTSLYGGHCCRSRQHALSCNTC